MENKTKTPKTKKTTFVVADPKDINRGDTIFIENKEGATPYLVIDYHVGCTYILIENLDTHWAGLYHYTTIYKTK